VCREGGVVLIDEWYLWAEGPAELSDVAAARLRELLFIAVDDFCRRLEADIAVLRGAADIHVHAVR
jgi:hypothetical protein